MIGLYILIIIIIVGWYIYGRAYKKEYILQIDKKDHPLLYLYPPVMLFIDRLNLYPKMISEKTKDAFISINCGRDMDKELKLYYCKKCTLALITIVVVTLIALIQEVTTLGYSQLYNGNRIMRPGYGDEDGGKIVALDVTIKDGEEFLEDQINIEVAERRYNNDMILTKLEEAKAYIDSTILADNNSLDNIRTPIHLVKRIPNTSITVRWELDANNRIDSKGNINNKDINEQGELTEIKAHIRYFDIEEIYPITLIIKPRIYTSQEIIWNEFWLKVKELEWNSKSEETQELPLEIGDKKVYYSEKKNKNNIKIFTFGILVSALLYFLMDKDIEDRFEKRETEVLIDYPEIINKFILLIGAGMTVKKAWEKIVVEYVNKTENKKNKKRYAFEEMRITYHELSNGIIEEKAYESYGRRMKALPYLKFTSLLIQNQKKGMKGLLELLEYEAVDAFNERKELAKRLGEEASTKLLIPMMIMLLIVLAIIMVPAFWGL